MSGADEAGRRPLPPDLGRLLHDLRGPLNSLTMHAEVLKRTVRDDPAAEDSLRTVLEQLGRLAEMLPAAFQVASLELGERAAVDLKAVATAAQRASGGTVRLASGQWPRVTGDEALLVEALTQIFLNASEATVGEARAPEAEATVEDGVALVSVRDWGPGLRTTNPKLLIRLMHSTKPGHRGLGLVTVERIARLHGGEVRFESAGDGTRVTLVLPAAR